MGGKLINLGLWTMVVNNSISEVCFAVFLFYISSCDFFSLVVFVVYVCWDQTQGLAYVRQSP